MHEVKAIANDEERLRICRNLKQGDLIYGFQQFLKFSIIFFPLFLSGCFFLLDPCLLLLLASLFTAQVADIGSFPTSQIEFFLDLPAEYKLFSTGSAGADKVLPDF